LLRKAGQDGCSAQNVRAIRCYKKCGFQLEGRERESVRVGDGWHDDVIMGKLSTDHRMAVPRPRVN
jgi:RimJ/RimL family protein N-acetyltransferase